MKSYVEFVTTPTVDTPGTLLFLHFDSRRYLIGNVSEGTARACIERGIGLRKVSTILLTGRTEWANVGGLLGLVLNLADVKHVDKETTDLSISNTKLSIYSAPNLNHMIASSRRFIFRKGMPMNIVEYHRAVRKNNNPDWEDDCIRVWTMSILPRSSKSAKSSTSSPRKRSYDEMDEESSSSASSASGEDPHLETRQVVVSQMFNSTWRLDNLLPQKLSEVRLPAKIFVRDSVTKQYSDYEGPLPGGTEAVPDITVWAREPWPGALTEHLPPTRARLDAVSYIIRNHPQRGRFIPAKAEEFKVQKGRLWSHLAAGHTVKNLVGEDVTPQMVLEPGKDGGGFAVVDIPSVEYLDALIQRPEWRIQEIMVGVEAIIWILGCGVAKDERLLNFQVEMSHLKHVMSSPDCCPNVLAFEAAAANALRHNHIDDNIFPKLVSSPIHFQKLDPSVLQISPHAVAAQRGQILTLEPKFELKTSGIKPALDLTFLQEKFLEEFKSLDESGALSDRSNLEVELQDWNETFHHGNSEIMVLGTGSSHPSQCRNVSGTLIRVPGCGSYLLDCGEGSLGTLKRMFTASELQVILQDLKMIWISHMHADHHLGITSMINAWSSATSDDASAYRLTVVSDAPMLQWLHEYGTAEDFGMNRVIPLATTPAQVVYDKLEVTQGTRLTRVWPVPAHEDKSSADGEEEEVEQYLAPLKIKSLETVHVSHCKGAQAVSVTFTSGLKISYSGDCRPSANFAVIGRDSHVLIHEATFEDDMRSEAVAKKHSTAGEAFIVACEMKARVCLLTHFSQRYPEMPRLGVPRGTKASSSSLLVAEAVEDPLESQPEPNMAESVAAEEHENGEAVHPLRPVEESSSEDIIACTLRDGPARWSRRSTGLLDLIEESDIQQLKSQHNIKVLFAFDYMRLRLGDVPILERKQPLLRQMYDRGIGKDMLKDGDEDEEGKQRAQSQREAQRVKEERKKAKVEKVGLERKRSERRAKASEEKWARAREERWANAAENGGSGDGPSTDRRIVLDGE